MKFYNNVQKIESSSSNYLILDNSIKTQDEKSAVIITIQIMNNISDLANISFSRSTINKVQDQNITETFSNYDSNVQVKNGTTILDHVIVVPYGQRYYVKSDTVGIIVSCSYGI